MALIGEAFTTYLAEGLREDLTDVIYDISPTETPFMSNAARTTAKAKRHDWQIDSLATAAANAQLEGDTISAAATVATNKLQAPTQISYKAFAVTGTTEAVDKAGRSSEVSYQIAKHGKELKRDMEVDLTQNVGTDFGGASSARTFPGLESWIASNGTELGTGATTIGYATATGIAAAPTDGSKTSAITEGHLKLAIQEAWTAGGNPEMVMVGPTTKQDISGFSGIATMFQAVDKVQGALIGAADLYISDFGRHSIVPSRFSRDRTALILDMSMWAVAFLRPMQQHDLAKRGDAEEKFLLTEYTLESRNEAASAKISGIT
jgi:hypothetical protein